MDQTGSTAQPDWSAAFAQAGLDMGSFRQVESAWIPPTYADTRVAWEGAYRDHADIPIRVEAAAYRENLVSFHITPPWEKPVRQEEVSSRATRRAAGFILALVFFVVLVASVLLARRNLRLGRGDLKGAFKLAFFVLIVLSTGQMIGADHIPALSAELDILFNIIAWALVASVLIWVLYIALEPYVRRLWPRLIISWSRLLAGGFRDPMVGRDILIGSLLGLGHTLTICMMPVTSTLAGKPSGPITSINPETLGGAQSVITDLLSRSVIQWFAVSVGPLFILLLLYILLRRQWLAAASVWLLFGTV